MTMYQPYPISISISNPIQCPIQSAEREFFSSPFWDGQKYLNLQLLQVMIQYQSAHPSIKSYTKADMFVMFLCYATFVKSVNLKVNYEIKFFLSFKKFRVLLLLQILGFKRFYIKFETFLISFQAVLNGVSSTNLC